MAIPEKILEGIDRLDPLPTTAQRLIGALNDDRVSINEIVDVIEYDEAVASNILRVANSPAYAGRFAIDRLRDAVVRLGTAAMLDIVLGRHLKSLKTAAPLYELTENDLWLHAAATSLAVKAIMQENRSSKVPQSATIGGLVHDIGKLIMVRFLDTDVSAIRKLCNEQHLTFVEAERELFGCDHSEVGAAMARKWSFPEPIIEVVERHHQVEPVEPHPTLDAVILANLAAKAVGTGLGAEGLNLCVDSLGSRERLGINVEGFERVCAQTSIWLSGLKNVH